jgi:ketosteroid isomerase-like protein
MLHTILLLALLTPSESPATATTALPSVSLPPHLARVLTDYEAAWSARSADALSVLFTEDGFVLSGGHPPVRGREEIRRFYSTRGGPLSLRALHYAIGGSVGFIIGAYAAKAGALDDGKFTLTLRKAPDGRWLIVSDMDNGNQP